MDDLTWDLDEEQPKAKPTANPSVQPDIVVSPQSVVPPSSVSPPNPTLVAPSSSPVVTSPPPPVVPVTLPPLASEIAPSGITDFKRAFLELVSLQDRQMRFAGVRLGERNLADKIYDHLFVQSGYDFGLDAPSSRTLAYLLARVYLRFLYAKEDILGSVSHFDEVLQDEAEKLNIRLNQAALSAASLPLPQAQPYEAEPKANLPVLTPSLQSQQPELPLPEPTAIKSSVPEVPSPVPPEKTQEVPFVQKLDAPSRPVSNASDPHTYVYETSASALEPNKTRPQRPYLDLDAALASFRPQILKEAATRNGGVSLGYGLEYRIDTRGFIDFYKDGRPLELYSLRLNPQGQIMTEETIRSLMKRVESLPVELKLILQELSMHEQVIQTGFKEALFEQMKAKMIFKVSFGDHFELRIDPPLEASARPVARLFRHNFWEDGRDPWPIEFKEDYVLFNTGQRMKYHRYRDRIVLENWRILDPQKLTGEVRLDGSVHFHHIRPNFVGLLDSLYSYYRSSDMSQKGWDFRFNQSSNIGLIAGEKKRLIEEDLVIIGPSEKVVTTLTVPDQSSWN